mgnify:FL=1
MVNKISKILIIIVAILTCVRVSCRSPDKNIRMLRQDNLQASRSSDDFRKYIKNNLRERLDPNISSLAIAYLLGDKSGLSNSLKEEIDEVGIAHLVVISGMHLAILVKIISKGLRFTSRLVKSYFCVLFIVLYIGMIGLTPSLLRAGFVIFCQLFVSYFGRKLDNRRIIFFTVVVTLLVNPNYIDNLGWQLSMLAYIGILVLDPLIESFLFGEGLNKRRSIKKKNYIAKMLTKVNVILNFRSGFIIAIAVNMMVLPIILYRFGYFSLISIFITLILTPLMPMILFSVAMIGLLPYRLYQYTYFLMGSGVGLLRSQINIIKIFSGVQILSINVKKNNTSFLLLYFLVIILYFFLRKKDVDISKNSTSQNNQSIKGSDGMQDIGTYLIEWQKQLQLRCQQYKNKTSQTETFNNVKKSS